ncbi:NmrA-like family protein [Aspergillus affinis]|uniref:NmrA-like family protein n=1 Tax=Aspergillus affinis TaxID=1070780 RepID=UPI0022FE451F|nr:transcription factor NmrA [Aspergillus affinis]KAI9042802.1 transcription factor NmrA [Aspergillus affinis]
MTITLLITGATGKQESAVITNLIALDAEVEILAVTRNAQSRLARNIADKSPKIKLLEGNLDDPEGIFRAAKKISSGPVYGVFSVQTPSSKNTEERQAPSTAAA